jgi:O-antigen ligase
MPITKIEMRRNDIAGVRILAPALAFLLPFMSLTVKGGLHIAQLVILVIALWLLNKGLADFYARQARTIRWVVAGFGGYFLISLLRLVYFQQSMNTLDGPLRLLLALSCIGVIACLKPDVRWFWLGLCTGTIGAGLIALVQRFAFGMERVEGFTHHPITFGDLSVALGVMSLCALSGLRTSRLAWLPVLALLSGVLAAVLSGSRGAWLGLLLVLLPLLKFGGKMQGRLLWCSSGLVLLACVGAYFLPATGVARRVAEAVSDVNQYVVLRNPGTNVGVRLELWKASLMMIAEHPWLGVGRDAFHSTLQALAAQGRLQHSVALDYSSSHNDVLHTLATGGIVDFSFLLLMYAGPLLFFWKVLKHSDGERAALGLAGVVLVICFFGFGLTDVMFWLMIPKVFYGLMVCAIMGFCLAMPAPADAMRNGTGATRS